MEKNLMQFPWPTRRLCCCCRWRPFSKRSRRLGNCETPSGGSAVGND